MIIVAHPDDETYGMGATLIKLAEQNEVFVLTLCKGNGQRVKVFDKITKELNIESHVGWYPDTQLDVMVQTKLIDYVQNIYDDFKPDIVFTHTKDVHRDHTIVSEIVDVVTRPRVYNSIQKLYHFSIPGNSEWSHNWFKPNTFVNITDYTKRKASCLTEYNLYQNPDPLSNNKIHSKDDYWGSIAGFEKAEAFELMFSREL